MTCAEWCNNVFSFPVYQAQAGMPKLHPLAQELSIPQKSSLPPQPALSKPIVPPPSLSTSVIPGGGNAPPPAMPTLHKISATPTPIPPPQAAVPQQHVQQQKTTPTVGGAIPTPPLKANPTSAMPKLTTSLGQQVKPTPTGLPILSRAPMALQPPPGSRPHLQPRPLTHPQQTFSSGSGFQLNPLVKATSTVAPPKMSTNTAAAVSNVGKSARHGGSSGKTGKSHGSGTKKKKK